ncbi:conjugal transfer protein TraD [Sphingomonas sp.]|uniref:conjugal transfer protein TraD n=1 Tax=Sphingomonas sp. TaxID=28214 RepID=UPI003D6CDF41
MRKPRDFDAELKVLNERAKQLQARKIHQFGELVLATGADALSSEELIGLLLGGVENKDASAREVWRKRGAAFFQRTRRAVSGSQGDPSGNASN